MHACLLIPEILKHIFSTYRSDLNSTDDWNPNIYPYNRNYLSRRSLVALSCVCHSFKDVALDVLWAKLEDLEPLFSCLPQDLWTKTHDGKLVIQRPVTTADWLVFTGYASRVRVIMGPRWGDIFGHVDAGFVYAMMGFSSQSQLVPNLRELYGNGCAPDLHPCMRYLLGPNLVRLHLTPQKDDFWTDIMSSVLSGLGRHSPRLQIVELHATSPKVSELALCGLPHLRRVSLTLHGDEDLSWLSRLAGLQVLNINIVVPISLAKSPSRTSSLDRLIIRSFDLTLDGNMLEGWVVPCRRLELTSMSHETTRDIERTLRKLTNRVLFDALECIVLDFVAHIHNTFSLHTFTPLMRFSGLKEVHLPSLCTSMLDDDTLGVIVKSWPRLECLALGPGYFWRIPPKITFRGLVTVLSSCPNLRELGLVFDATKVDPPTAEKPGGGVCNTNITTFRVGSSPIKQPLQVAVALSAVLPCLRKLDVELDVGPNYYERLAGWEQVSNYISVLTLVRQQEGSRV